MSETTQGFDFSDVSVGDLLDQNTPLDTSSEDDNSQDEPDTSSDQNDDSQESDDQNDDLNTDDNQDDNSQEDNQDDDQDDSQDDNQDDNSDDDQEEEGEEDGPTIIEELQSLVGVELEEGEELPDDIQGIAQYAKKAGEKLGQQYLSNIFEAFPDVKKFFEFRSQGGDATKFFELAQASASYDNLTEDALKGNPALQKQVVAEMYNQMGFTEEDITDSIKDLEDSELLLKQAVKSSARLSAISKDKEQAELQRQADLAEQQKIEQIETWNQIGETVSSGNLKGFVVPETDKKAFMNWMSKPLDSKGTTQRQVDMQKMDVESTLALEYLYYKNFDLGKLAKNYKSTQRSNSLRDRIKTKNKKASPATKLKGGPRGGNSRAVSLPSLNDVF